MMGGAGFLLETVNLISQHSSCNRKSNSVRAALSILCLAAQVDKCTAELIYSAYILDAPMLFFCFLFFCFYHSYPPSCCVCSCGLCVLMIWPGQWIFSFYRNYLFFSLPGELTKKMNPYIQLDHNGNGMDFFAFFFFSSQMIFMHSNYWNLIIFFHSRVVKLTFNHWFVSFLCVFVCGAPRCRTEGHNDGIGG